MKSVLSLLFFAAVLIGNDELGAFLKAYDSQQMTQACKHGRELYRMGMEDENILIAIGDACSRADYINFVGVLQQRLGESAKGREAAVYFSTLLLKRRLISQYMYEGIDLQPYELPITDHILSRVFEKIKKNEVKIISEHPKHIEIEEGKDQIQIYVKNKIHIDLYKNGEKIREHRYRK